MHDGLLFFFPLRGQTCHDQQTASRTTYLTISTLIVVPSTYYICNVAINVQSAVSFLHDGHGDLLVPKPVPCYAADFVQDEKMARLCCFCHCCCCCCFCCCCGNLVHCAQCYVWDGFQEVAFCAQSEYRLQFTDQFFVRTYFMLRFWRKSANFYSFRF